jgi:hypothetical protein
VSSLTYTVQAGGSTGAVGLRIGLAPTTGQNAGQIQYGLQFNLTEPEYSPNNPGVYVINNFAYDNTKPLNTAPLSLLTTATMTMTNGTLSWTLPGVTAAPVQITPLQNLQYAIGALGQGVQAPNTLTVTVAQ